MAWRISVTGKPGFKLALSCGEHSEFLSSAPVMNTLPEESWAGSGLKGLFDIERYRTTGGVMTSS